MPFRGFLRKVQLNMNMFCFCYCLVMWTRVYVGHNLPSQKKQDLQKLSESKSRGEREWAFDEKRNI